MQGLRSSKNRSLLDVNEDFENKHNAAVRLYTSKKMSDYKG